MLTWQACLLRDQIIPGLRSPKQAMSMKIATLSAARPDSMANRAHSFALRLRT
jgi:hypothetical protein